MKSSVLGIVVVLALLATGAIFFGADAFRQQQVSGSPEQLYANDMLGISFSYPTGYILSEQEIGTANRAHYIITLIAEEDATPRVNSEGPTAITLDFYQNSPNEISLDAWMRGTNESNFNLGNGAVESTTVDSSTEAVYYTWSGLYNGETTAFIHNGNIVSVSATYMSTDDQIYKDYQTILHSIRLR